MKPYLRLHQTGRFSDRNSFSAQRTLAMRHALINHAAARSPTSAVAEASPSSFGGHESLGVDTDEGLIMLHQALQRLATEMPRLADVIECRFFGGYGEEDTAKALGLSLRTVQRDWLTRAVISRVGRNKMELSLIQLFQ